MYADPTISRQSIRRAPSRRATKPAGSPAMVGMLLALAFLAREPFMICLRRFLGRPGISLKEHPAAGWSLASIRGSVLGQYQDYITDLYGLPRVTSQGACPVWYYPLDAQQRLAMAVTFHERRAVLVEFFHFS